MKKTIQRAQGHLEILSDYLDGNIVTNQGIFTLEIGEHIGTGDVQCVCFNKFMSAIQITVCLFEDTVLPLNNPDSEFVYFLYGLEGDCLIGTEDMPQQRVLEKLQTAVICSTEARPAKLLLKKDERYIFNMIGIDKNRYQEEFKGTGHVLDGKLPKLLDHFGDDKKPLYIGQYNLQIGERIKLLVNQESHNDISSYLHFEGSCHLILANQIEQFFDDQYDNSNLVSLTKRELEEVKDISDFVYNYPEVQHSIKSLCSRSGLSPNKLQEGFKFMHNRTVSDFIRNVRIEKAERLIRTTDLNISEVVYTIGLTSRSYFCKIFKNKYHCSPKQYKKKCNIPSSSVESPRAKQMS